MVCGHTHRRAGPLNLAGMIGINIGSDYGAPKGALFSSDSIGLNVSWTENHFRRPTLPYRRSPVKNSVCLPEFFCEHCSSGRLGRKKRLLRSGRNALWLVTFELKPR